MTGNDSIFHNFPLTKEISCSYFPERISRLQYCFADEGFDSEIVELFLDRGFRRSTDLFYRTECPKCRMCIPYRIDLNQFMMNSSQKRNLKINADLYYRIRIPEPNLTKQELYLKYIYSRHHNEKESTSDESILETMRAQMYDYIENSLEMEIYHGDILLGFGILDIGSKTISSVYNVYDPENNSRGLGTYMILQSIDWAKRLEGIQYLQLGLFIPGHPKMDYKKNLNLVKFYIQSIKIGLMLIKFSKSNSMI